MRKRIFLMLLPILVLFIGSCATLGFVGGNDTKQLEINKEQNNAKNSVKGVELTFKDDSAQSVSVAGEFNNWDASANPMKKENGIWKIILDLKPGKYQYKFVVNGTEWKTDPQNPEKADDGYGGQNSILTVGENKVMKKVETETVNTEKTNSTSGKIPVKFSYQPLTGGKHQVYVAGDFNNWSTEANPMKENNGLYETVIYLKKGKYAYKFVVDGNWITDENAAEFVGDGFGGQNSIVYAGNPEDLNSLRKVEFVYKPDKPVKEVYLVGSFNAWNQKADKMDKADDGTYHKIMLLKPDEYQYKFLVNGTDWITDDNAENFADDGFGGKNSIITVDERFPKVTLAKKDGLLLTYGIPTEQSLETVNPLSPTQIEFKTKAHSNDVQKVYLWKNGEKIEMDKIAEDGSFDYFRTIVNLKNKNEEFDYYFIYRDGEKEFYLLNGEISENLDKDKIFHYSSAIVKPFFTPDWVKKGVIYQIFMDRFCNGNKENDQDFHEWYYEGCRTPPPPGKKLKPGQSYYHLVKDWYDIEGLKKSPYEPNGKPDWWSFYGGDVAGVQQKLDYLVDLGITIIYFNPIFEAKSNHKYDAADYMKIDPHFGTQEEFKNFVRECHKRGIKIILDTAFNHTGETFWAFQDAKKKGPESKYYHWYEWKKWPLPDPIPADFKPSDYYECWWGFGDMPDLDYDLSRPNPAENGVKDISQAEPNWDVVNYVLGVADFWVGEMDVDGFRLDVPNEVPFWFWKLFRERVKSLKPDAYLVGELWSNAVEWVNNEYFDAVMNYAYFKDPVMRFFNMRKCNAKTFDRDLKPGLLNYPTQATQVMMNLIDSHDTFRYLESAGGDVDRLKMAAFFEMTYVGAPHIWYGDEVGMMGGHDPDCRRPFNWKYTEDPQKVALRDYYKKLIKIRKENPALMLGSFQTLYAKGMMYAFLRNYQNENIIVVINNENTKKKIIIPVDLPDRMVTDLVSGNRYEIRNKKLEIELEGLTGAILK